jgi:hypothetical protein
LVFFELLEIEQRVVRALRRADQLVELDLDRFGVAVLGVLDQEHHQERHDRRRRVDHELPGVAEIEQRPADQPGHDQERGPRKRRWAPAETRSDFRELRIPGFVLHRLSRSLPTCGRLRCAASRSASD